MRVLLATDGSPDARAATTWLAGFPLPRTAELLVVSVVPMPLSAIDFPTAHAFDAMLVDDGRRTAEDARAGLAPRYAKTDVRAAMGDAREEILRIAKDWKADLIVLGARGRGPFASGLLGSVSLGVARHAHCPVLVVRGAARPLRTILLGVDGSSHAQTAARFLASLPLDAGTTARLVAVLEPPPVPASAPRSVLDALSGAIDRITRERRAALERGFVEAEAALSSRVGVLQRVHSVGRPHMQLAEAAAAPDVDLAVVGARGLGGFARLLLGSVSEHVLLHARCPVLIVRTP